MFDVLLQHHHVVRVLLACHVNPEVPGHVGLVVADIAAESRLRFLCLRADGAVMVVRVGVRVGVVRVWARHSRRLVVSGWRARVP